MLATVATPAADAPGFVRYEDAFAEVVGEAPVLTKMVDTDACEGPGYVADEDARYFTAVPTPVDVPLPGSRSVAIRRLALDGDRFPVDPGRRSVVREPANTANGMTLDREGRLVVCEQGTRTEPGRISLGRRLRLTLCFGIRLVGDSWGDTHPPHRGRAQGRRLGLSCRRPVWTSQRANLRRRSARRLPCTVSPWPPRPPPRRPRRSPLRRPAARAAPHHPGRRGRAAPRLRAHAPRRGTR